MATKPQASIDRIRAANGNAYDPINNPGGLAQGGHRQNFVPDLNAAVDVADYTADLAGEANTSATNAANSASGAATSATNAASSATDSANSAARFQGTSSTNNTPSIANKTFTTQPNKAFTVGTFLLVQSRGTVSRWMFGKATAYNTSTGSLTIAVEAIGATTSSATDWDILATGARGSGGPESWSSPAAWTASTPYSASPPRSTVVYDGETYVATTTHTSGTTFDAANWIKIAQKGSQLTKATGAEVRGFTDDVKYVTPKAIADAQAFFTSGNFSTSQTFDLSIGFNFNGTLVGNTTINAPINAKSGMTGVIQLTQDITGGRTVAWNTFWDFGADGPPTVNAASNAVDYVFYTVLPSANKAICAYKRGNV